MRIRRMFQYLVVFTLILIALPQAVSQENKKSFLWEVKSPTSTAYLLGSIHFMKMDMYPLDSVIEDAFEKSSSLVVELNPMTIDQMKMQQEMMQRGMYAGDKTVKDSLGKDVFEMLKTHLETNNLPVADFMKFKPGMTAMTLATMQIMSLGFSPEYGIDPYFIKKTQGKKPIIELETIEDQLSLFLGDTLDNNLLVKQTIVEWENTEKELGLIVSSWNDGDADGMADIVINKPLEKNPELLPVYKSFFFERNKKMATKIEALLKTKQTYFVVVGSGHLIGDKGIINLLKEKNYSVRQM